MKPCGSTATRKKVCGKVCCESCSYVCASKAATAPSTYGRLGENTKRTQRPGRSVANCRHQTPFQKSREFLLDGEGNILIDRYEWFLYQQIPDRLNGQLTLPDITKYRALDADLIDGEHWRKTNIRCFNRAILQN